MRTLIIAEIGENHLGDMSIARDLVVASAEAGADIVKFQSYRGSEVAPDDPERDWFTRVALSDEAHHELKELAERSGIRFMSAAFTLDRARFLVESLGATEVKVASSEMLNRRLLGYLDGRVERVFLSTGLATLDEVREAVAMLERTPDVFVMQCTTSYPCAPDDANLLTIPTLAAAFPHRKVGFSDHTIGTVASVASVALGARAIEKHLTFDRHATEGTDHVLSVEPDELAALVRDVRAVERMLGSATKEPTAGELEIRDFVRSRFPK